MSPANSRERSLQYFIHDDFDALRMEISGSLAGRDAQKAYDALRRESFMVRGQPLVIDISYVTDVDAQGQAVLQAWRGEGAQIVAAAGAFSIQRPAVSV